MSDIRDEVDRLVRRELRLERDLCKALKVLSDCKEVLRHLAKDKPADSIEAKTFFHADKLLVEVKL